MDEQICRHWTVLLGLLFAYFDYVVEFTTKFTNRLEQCGVKRKRKKRNRKWQMWREEKYKE